MAKYIFVVGGVMSGVGKGVATSSIGALLQARGFNVTAVKIDPYINVDAGTMNPVEHGETFVTDDGLECDQDIGNYERFLNRDLSSVNYMTTGRVYRSVISKERNLEYGGKTVEVIPHVTDEVIRRLQKSAREAEADFVLVEVGGTVGEYQNLVYLEAARILHLRHPEDVLYVLVTYLPMPNMIGEMKTKPTQHAVRTLNSAGIQPDIIIARAEKPLDGPRKKKIAIFCNTEEGNIISAPDIKTSIYEIPINFEKENVGKIVLNRFGMRERQPDFENWEKLVGKIYKSIENKNNGKDKIKIGIVGKYFESGNFVLSDAYISVIEAIKHAAWKNNVGIDIDWLNSTDYEGSKRKNIQNLKKYNGIIVPGGFGARGTKGKINVIQYCRENKVPFLGLCYGMQMAVIEFSRNVCGMKSANSTEIDPSTDTPVIDVMPEQKLNLRKKHFGATMRLGAYDCELKPKTMARKLYAQDVTSERHRHRYEVNNEYLSTLEDNGLVVSGVNPKKGLVEIIEIKDHPFFIATQFHPEFKSRPFDVHPLFDAFAKHCKK
ncbi:MAG: CTP synthase [Candidatus Spechtbacterales bacterium]|nr:CTP synthase [Candidatus Spechtbacterales bacterium]